ncbi:MAG: hypothetical protein Q9160_006826 [Pyrenula sp. 1 TL-2023]
MEQDDPPSPFKVPSVPGAPLYPASPERMNQNRPPPSPAVAAVLTNSEKHHRRQTSEVQSKVAFLNSLSRPGTPNAPVPQPQTNAQSASAALQRALMGREEAESALILANAQISQAHMRERKISERVESLIEDLQSAKERQAHERQVFEKEVRKARKDAFRAGSALVKLQEDLKEARTENSGLRKDIQREKEAKEMAKQEAFERAYTLSGQAEELQVLKEQLRSMEAERDAAQLAHKAGEMVRPEPTPTEQKQAREIPDRPSHEDRSEEQYLNDTMTWIKGVVRGDEPEEIHELKSEISFLQFQVRGTMWKIEQQKKDLQFQLLSCQGKLCPCRLAEKRGEYYIYDQEKHNRLMKRPEFAQKYQEEMDRLKPAREAHQAEVAREQAVWEAEAPARAERQRKWEETKRRNMSAFRGLTLKNFDKWKEAKEAANTNNQSAPSSANAGKAAAGLEPAQTDVKFSPTSGTFQKVEIPANPSPSNPKESEKAEVNSHSFSDDRESSLAMPRDRPIGAGESANDQPEQNMTKPQEDKVAQVPLRQESGHPERQDVDESEQGKDTQAAIRQGSPMEHPERSSSASSSTKQAPPQAPDMVERDAHEGDAEEEFIARTLPRPLSALTAAGESLVRQGAISPALSAFSSGPAPAPLDEVLFSDDEDDIVTSARASNVQSASQPADSQNPRNSGSPIQTPVRPRSQTAGTIANITTTTFVPLRGHDDSIDASDPTPGTPGTPISREAALAQIRARRDRARSVVLKEAKTAPGTPANARRGLTGGLSVLRSAGPDKGVDKAREFSAHSNAF